MVLKRKFDKLISQGTGSQLLWLLVLCLALWLTLYIVSSLFFSDLVWQDIVALFLDPGCFGGADKDDVFRLIVALLGCFTFSALLVSVFSNIIDNISDNWHQGRLRYKHKGHVIIFGSHPHSLKMLTEMTQFPDKDIVIVTSSDVEEYRSLLERTKLPADVRKRIVLYRGERDNIDDLRSFCPEAADYIYILGEKNEAEHDNVNLQCCKLLSEICADAAKDIYVYVVLADTATMEVISRTNRVMSNSALKVDYINISEYQAEELIVEGNFMPILKENDADYAHFVIFGAGDKARTVAMTIAHNAHYPNFTKTRKRTRIDFVSEEAELLMRDLFATFAPMFRMSHSEVHSEGAVKEYLPQKEYGDYMDLEWGFYNYRADVEDIQPFYQDLAAGNIESTRIIVCEDNDKASVHRVLHLPRMLRNIPIAVYQEFCSDIVAYAKATGLYGDITIFGQTQNTTSDALFLHRTERGRRVNHFYARMYGDTKTISEEKAWYSISEAHKFSSIYSGNASVLRNKSTNSNTEDYILCEMEHRRWMTSCLLLGYDALTLEKSAEVRADGKLFKSMKKNYIHADIAPFDDLSEDEQGKDKQIISAMR